MAVTDMDDDLNLDDQDLGGIDDDNIEQDELGNGELDQLDIEGGELGGDESGDEKEKPKDDGFDKEEYGKKVEKRIGKMTARMRTAEERAEAAERELAEIRSSQVNESMKAEHASVKQDLHEALEEGDPEAIVEAQDKLADIRARMNLKASPPAEQRSEDAGDTPAADNVPAAAAADWLKGNNWFNDRKNSRYANVAREIERELVNEGYDYDEELYAELDKRLEAEMPAVSRLRGSKQNDHGEQGRERGQETTAGNGRSVPAAERKRSATRLDKEDLSAMRKYGFDPDSPKDRKAWLNRDKL